MNEDLHAGLNEHLALEFGAAHQYLALAIWCELNDLPGFASWLKLQSTDELSHAHRIIDHLLERDLKVSLPAISEPTSDWPSALPAIETVLENEQRVTRSSEALHDLADKIHDRPATLLLQWCTQEQMEEENVVRSILGRLRLAGDTGLGLLLIDQDLSQGTVPGAMASADG